MAVASVRNSGVRGFMGALLGNTFLTRRANPYESFGPLAAMSRQSALRATDARLATAPEGGLLASLGRAYTFTVEEARRRLADLRSGMFRPGSAAELVTYLKTNFLGIAELHRDGRSSYHVIDRLSGQTVRAAEVDKKLLARKNLAPALGAKPAEQKRLAIEAAAAARYRAKLATFMRRAVMANKPVFDDWADLNFTLPSVLRGCAYAVRKGEGYIGTQVGICEGTPAETRELLAARQAEYSAKLGRKVFFVFDEKMAPGSPILLADENLVRARRIGASLTRERLEAAFGTAFHDHFRALDRGAASAPKERVANIVSIDEFRARFVKQAVEAAEVAKPEGTGFGYAEPANGSGSFDPRHVVIRYGKGDVPIVWHAKLERELTEVGGLRRLPAGDYVEEDHLGMPQGKIRVDEDGGLTHLTMAGVEHNWHGPSYEPAPGSGGRRRWAVEGQTFTNVEDFRAVREEAIAREQVTVASPEERRGFGYDAP